MYQDQHVTESLVPGVNDVYGKLSNSLINWMRANNFVNYMDLLNLQKSSDAVRVMGETQS